jgi:hypothetical protein
VAPATTTRRADAQAGRSDNSGPSLLWVGGTVCILLAFVIALIFLIRERSLLRRERPGPSHDDGS